MSGKKEEGQCDVKKVIHRQALYAARIADESDAKHEADRGHEGNFLTFSNCLMPVYLGYLYQYHMLMSRSFVIRPDTSILLVTIALCRVGIVMLLIFHAHSEFNQKWRCHGYTQSSITYALTCICSLMPCNLEVVTRLNHEDGECDKHES